MRPAHTSSQPPASMSRAAASNSILLSTPVKGRAPAGRALLSTTGSAMEERSARPGTAFGAGCLAVVAGGRLVEGATAAAPAAEGATVVDVVVVVDGPVVVDVIAALRTRPSASVVIVTGLGMPVAVSHPRLSQDSLKRFRMKR